MASEPLKKLKKKIMTSKSSYLRPTVMMNGFLKPSAVGANGYLLKGTAREDLIEAVKNTYFGKTYIDPEIGDKIFQQVSQGDPFHTPTLETELSQRELEVLHLLAKGFTNNEIADQLFLSNGTVRNYISTILNKLQVDNRTQAAPQSS